jgi:hypothetical protein
MDFLNDSTGVFFVPDGFCSATRKLKRSGQKIIAPGQEWTQLHALTSPAGCLELLPSRRVIFGVD